jgi:acyl dehydratase
MGLYYEEFELGESVLTQARTVCEADVVQFCGVSGDYNPLHTDEEFCRQTRYGSRIAHGPLTMSMAIGLMSQKNLIDGTTLGLLNLHWDFKAPVKLGDTVHAKVTPTEKRLTRGGDRGIVTLAFDVINQHGTVVQTGTATLMMKVKAAA